jgi:hypothetical protein
MPLGRTRLARFATDRRNPQPKDRSIRIGQIRGQYVLVEHKKTLVSCGITEKNQGFARMRAEGLEPSTQGLKVRSGTNENTGDSDPPQHFQQHLEKPAFIETPENDLLTVAKNSISSTRRDIEKLLESIPLDDEHTLGILGPILNDLESAQEGLRRLSN